MCSIQAEVSPCACGCLWPCSYSQPSLTAKDLSYCAQRLLDAKKELSTTCLSLDYWLKNHSQEEPNRIDFALLLANKQQTLFSVQSRIEQILYHQRARCQEELTVACNRLDRLSGPISHEEDAVLRVKINELQRMLFLWNKPQLDM
jgi:hypothetical protein